jgi:hypothetical protein
MAFLQIIGKVVVEIIAFFLTQKIKEGIIKKEIEKQIKDSKNTIDDMLLEAAEKHDKIELLENTALKAIDVLAKDAKNKLETEQAKELQEKLSKYLSYTK